jgi:hypothetical protein
VLKGHKIRADSIHSITVRKSIKTGVESFEEKISLGFPMHIGERTSKKALSAGKLGYKDEEESAVLNDV